MDMQAKKLGNVLVVITDQVHFDTAPQPSMLADVSSTRDYYPFGLEMDGRTWSDTTAYRYGFNGKEKDSSAEWGSTAYDYGFRIYDPTIAKFLSVDPLTKGYPWYTPYQFAGNKPICAVDLDGLEERLVLIRENKVVIDTENSDVIYAYWQFYKSGDILNVYWEKGWEEYSGYRPDAKMPKTGQLRMEETKDGLLMTYDPSWESYGFWREVGEGFGSGAILWDGFLHSNEEGPRVARKWIFGIVGATTGGYGLFTATTYTGATLAGVDLFIAANDVTSATVDASDGLDIEIDIVKGMLIAQLGPEAGDWFERGKVVLSAVGTRAAAKSLLELKNGAKWSLAFKNEKTRNAFLNLFGTSLGLADDIGDASKFREDSKSKP